MARSAQSKSDKSELTVVGTVERALARLRRGHHENSRMYLELLRLRERLIREQSEADLYARTEPLRERLAYADADEATSREALHLLGAQAKALAATLREQDDLDGDPRVDPADGRLVGRRLGKPHAQG